MTDAAAYQVLARKYRPQTFADLIGQDVMVRTLRNAFAAERVAHAFMLTGVRGVGKTTTARIVAKGLNCIGPDGRGAMSIDPCGLCPSCRAIAEGRSIDVVEYDAASNTQVDKMREILASLPYRPTEARFKVIIFDEVHMLSPGAFNALLKTLEEPPEHVKFIFATTEIRKVPVTILSRCQRFDLRRIEPEALSAHLRAILAAEGAEVAPDALALIVRAAEGSVRDALSLLDQAIAHGAGSAGVEQVRAMLGLADRGRIMDLFDLILRGEAAAALAELSAQYAAGGDPLAILRDLAEVAHWVSVVRITPGAAEDPTVPPDERRRGAAMASQIPLRVLSRMWQMLLKAIEEVSVAPNAMMAAEMAVIRLTHVADLPDPETLMRRLSETPHDASPGRAGPAGDTPGARAGGNGPFAFVPSGHAAPGPGSPGLGPSRKGPGRDGAGGGPGDGVRMVAGGQALPGGPMAQAAPVAEALAAAFPSFAEVVGLIRDRRDMKLLFEVETHLRLASYAPGRIEFEPAPDAPRELASMLGQRLQLWTGQRWGVSVVAAGGGRTISEARAASEEGLRQEARGYPLVATVLEAFPRARISAVRRIGAAVAASRPDVADLSPGTDDGSLEPEDWDPFEDN
ncbi:MAG: DNA polymerase III subunit gamma/tau [Pseudomonadota bacterium]